MPKYLLLLASMLFFTACDNPQAEKQAINAMHNADSISEYTQDAIESTADVQENSQNQETLETTHAQAENRQYFKATGNEPFWHLQIYGDQHLNFNFLGEEEKNIAINLADVNVTREKNGNFNYSIATEEYTIEITLDPTPCTDDMSGFPFPYTVLVKFTQDGNSTTYNGCGEYRGDYRLHDIWALEFINGDSIDFQEIFPPGFELNLSGGLVEGSTGCNDFHCYIDVDGDNISFKHVQSTLKACEEDDMALESKFYNALQGNSYTFSIEKRRLTLESEENTLVFRKVD